MSFVISRLYFLRSALMSFSLAFGLSWMTKLFFLATGTSLSATFWGPAAGDSMRRLRTLG